LRLEALPPKQLLECMSHLLKAAGNPKLLSPSLVQTLCEHATGNLRLLMNIPRVLFVLQARAEKVNGLVDERMMGIRVEFSSLGAHRFDQTIRFLPGQSVTNVFTAKDWMGSSLFVKDVPPIPIEHETRGPNSHQVPHDLSEQWFRHVGRESDIPEEPLPSALERA
jgi:hypothetical protein